MCFVQFYDPQNEGEGDAKSLTIVKVFETDGLSALDNRNTVKPRNHFTIKQSRGASSCLRGTRDKERWVLTLQLTFMEERNIQAKNGAAASPYHLVFVPDIGSQNCAINDKAYSFVNGRHHRLICGECASSATVRRTMSASWGRT